MDTPDFRLFSPLEAVADFDSATAHGTLQQRTPEKPRRLHMSSVVRVSILTIPEGRIDEAAEAMRKAEAEVKGILQLKGLRSYFAGVDRARSQLTNVSVWDSLEDAEQMSKFQPMLNLAKRFAADGATFLQPIPNFDCLWQWGDLGGPGAADH
jgi:hypothetical protein